MASRDEPPEFWKGQGEPFCTVAWGSHACFRGAGHDGPHSCHCCPCKNHDTDYKENGCVALPPYYEGFGGTTAFYNDPPLPKEN